jgi:triphosphoribosyl-dephospho-CoA synthase
MMEIVHTIGATAMESMLFEVASTPKPGLVDRRNCGAHHDMDYFTFMSSAAALHASFAAMAALGIERNSGPVADLLGPLREIGREAERKMFAATGNVNTHKGMIFTMGILCACAGWAGGKLPLQSETLCALAAEMCRGLCNRELGGLAEQETRTKGERMYLQYGCRGVRGEVESGYETIRKVSLPVYRKLRTRGLAINDALIQTLLHLIAKTQDTNIVSRHDPETAAYARQYAQQVLAQGGMLTPEGRVAVDAMDEEFIRRWISPGGCADLLAVTHFLYTIEERTS